MNKLSLIIPVKNEETNLAALLQSYCGFFASRRLTLKTEVLVVSESPSTKIREIVKKYEQKYPFVRLIETVYDFGKGGAISLGINEAVGDFIGYIDSNGSISASETYELYSFLEETPWLDGVIGKRILSPESKIKLDKIIPEKIFNFWVNLFFRFNYADVRCPLKLFRKEPAKNIGKKLSHIDDYFDINFLLIARYLNYSVFEKDISWRNSHNIEPINVMLFKLPFKLLKLKELQFAHLSSEIFSKLWDRGNIDKLFSDSKNILIFSWKDPKNKSAGSLEEYIYQVSKRLSKKHSVIIFSARSGNQNTFDEIEGIKIIRKGNSFTVFFWAMFYYIMYLRNKVDLVIDMQKNLPFFSPLYCYKSKILITEYVKGKEWFRAHFLPIALIGFFTEVYVMPFVYKHIPVLTLSLSSKEDLNTLGFIDKRIYIAHGSVSKKTGGNYDKSKTPLLLYLGRVEIEKQLEVALITLRELQKKVDDLELVIAGTGSYDREIKDLAKRLNLEDNIKFLGYVSERKKWQLLQKAWILLNPSFKEGWSASILEAASCSTPCVGFDVAGIRDSIKEGSTGLLSHDLEEFINNTHKLIKDRHLRKRMGENAKEWADSFDWKNTADIVEELVDALSSGKKLLADKIYPWQLEPDVQEDEIETLLLD